LKSYHSVRDWAGKWNKIMGQEDSEDCGGVR
jgi:hypothetical protein